MSWSSCSPSLSFGVFGVFGVVGVSVGPSGPVSRVGGESPNSSVERVLERVA